MSVRLVKTQNKAKKPSFFISLDQMFYTFSWLIIFYKILFKNKTQLSKKSCVNQLAECKC